jgi:hypothetical protein
VLNSVARKFVRQLKFSEYSASRKLIIDTAPKIRVHVPTPKKREYCTVPVAMQFNLPVAMQFNIPVALQFNIAQQFNFLSHKDIEL